MFNLTQEQAKALNKLLGRVLINIRILGWGGASDQAADLADTFHSLPYDLINPESFSWERLKQNIETYQLKYPANSERGFFDFLDLVNQIQSGTDLDNIS